MKRIKSFLKFIWRANPKAIYFNFKYLPWHQAIQFPIWVSPKTYLRKTKGLVSINAPVSPGMIRIGYGNIGIFDNKRSRTIWEVAGSVTFEGNAEIGHGSKISVGGQGELFFGNNFTVNAESTIIAYKKVTFGNDCLLSWDILIMDTDFHTITNNKGEILNPTADIIIGNRVWIGCRALILKGSVIPDGCVIAANSLITKQIVGNRQIIGGNPLTVLAQNINWNK